MDEIDSRALEVAVKQLMLDGMAALYRVVDRRWWWNGSDIVNQTGRVAARLHNQGDIDLIAFLLAVTSTESSDAKEEKALGTLFWGALPEIEAGADQVHAVLLHLVANGLAEGEEYWVGGKLKAWLLKEASRSRQILALAKAMPPTPIIGLFDVLVAGGETDPETFFIAALSLLEDERPNVRKSAVIALSNIAAPSVPVRRLALSALDQVVAVATSSDDQFFALSSLFRIFAQPGFDTPDDVQTTLDLAARFIDPATLRNAGANALINHGLAIGEVAITTILSWLAEISAEEENTLRMLDHGIYRLLEAGETERCTEFVGSYLKARPEESIKRFGVFVSGITQNPDRMDVLIYSWLKDGAQEVCTAAASILTQQGDDKFRLRLNLASLGATTADRIRICHRAIGHLFHLPVAVASILIAAMHGAAKDTQRKIGQLLLNPILMNYSGDAYDYVRSAAAETSDETAQELAEILKTFDDYRGALLILARVRELEPPESHRHAFQDHWKDEMVKAEELHEPSGLAALVSRSVVLFGSKVVTHVYPSMKAKPVRTVMHFQTVQIHRELPKLTVLDPVMQSYQGFGFRHGEDAE